MHRERDAGRSQDAPRIRMGGRGRVGGPGHRRETESAPCMTMRSSVVASPVVWAAAIAFVSLLGIGRRRALNYDTYMFNHT